MLRGLLKEKKIRALILCPFLTEPIGESIIDSAVQSQTDQDLLRSRCALALLRRSFFVDADHRALLSELIRILCEKAPAAGLHQMIHALLREFKGYSRFKAF